MDSINSWINEDEVRKLAEELSESSESIKQWKDKDCDGFAIPERQGQSSDAAFSRDVLKEVRESKSHSLAGASTMATLAGLLGSNKSEAEKVEKTEAVDKDELAKEDEADEQKKNTGVLETFVGLLGTNKPVDEESKEPNVDKIFKSVEKSVDISISDTADDIAAKMRPLNTDAVGMLASKSSGADSKYFKEMNVAESSEEFKKLEKNTVKNVDSIKSNLKEDAYKKGKASVMPMVALDKTRVTPKGFKKLEEMKDMDSAVESSIEIPDVSIPEVVSQPKDTPISSSAVVTKDVIEEKAVVEETLPEVFEGNGKVIDEVPVDVDELVSEDLPSVHAEKGFGTFEQIDKQLVNTVKANGVCVIDRDGDVLYSRMENQHLVAFTIAAMKGSTLMLIKDGEFGNIRLKIAANKYLEFVSVRSTRGVIVLAISINHILGSKNAKYVAADVAKIANLA